MGNLNLYSIDMPNGITYIGRGEGDSGERMGPESNPILLKDCVTVQTQRLVETRDHCEKSYKESVKDIYSSMKNLREKIIRIDGKERITHLLDQS